MPSSVARFVGLVALLVAPSTGCWYGAYNSNRALHYVDGELVQTEPPTPAAYEAYLRARLALEREPADLEAARGHILEALRWQTSDPQLWTVKAEIEWRAGKLDAAEQALARALELRPGYPEAQRLLARLRDGESMATAAR
jgi:cytochrome c-type biogenesis protein CcmH/NrfG